MENKLIGYADNSTLLSVVSSLGVRVTVAESLNRDLGKVSDWCDLLRMKLNASMTKTMIVSWLRTVHPLSPPLTIGGTVLKESDDLDICIGSDNSFQNDFLEASSLDFQSSFSKAWYLEEVLSSIPW